VSWLVVAAVDRKFDGVVYIEIAVAAAAAVVDAGDDNAVDLREWTYQEKTVVEVHHKADDDRNRPFAQRVPVLVLVLVPEPEPEIGDVDRD
jgi:hypothetical protein